MGRLLMISAAALGVLALAGCDQKPATPRTQAGTVDLPMTSAPAPVTAQPATPAAPLSGFSHDKNVDLSGYFLPVQPVTVGKWTLSDLSIGPEAELAKWESGQRKAAYAPVMLEFDDTTSPTKPNELGQQVHTVRLRVLPTAYKLGPGGALSFTAKDANLGDISFTGAVDTAALAKLRAAGPNGGPGAIVTGDLMLGVTPFKGETFSWFGGD